MKSCSHRVLGQYLTNIYLNDCSFFYRNAFSWGCIQPDKNPTTYLKGSIHSQWLRGHNWENAKKYIHKTGTQLQTRKHLKLLDFYRLGKLIHYTADAFTYSHNKNYSQNLAAHRCYETQLHRELEGYLTSLSNDYGIMFNTNRPVSEFISINHKNYMHHQPGIDNDVAYCVRMCAQVLQLMLYSKKLVSV